ncbi:MAG: mechanosensitive ion channel family protein [Deltaproteobacteria bacterium]|nr:mechanosensitive ion channel family protein [Deltaproteobacteria bacterium]
MAIASGPAAAGTSELQAALDQAMAAWNELQQQQIEVRSIEGLDAAAKGDGRAQVEARLRTLLTKRRSNREWHDYWNGEAEAAQAVRKAQDALVASGGLSEAEAARYVARRPALDAWVALAKAKLVNQDTYFEAITADLEAVEERLRAFGDEEDSAAVAKRSKVVCEADVTRGETPLHHQRLCVQATEAEERALEERLEQTQATRRLTQAQLESIETLITAQRRDIALAEEELAISTSESARARTSPNETERWRDVWSTYETRAQTKTAQLTEALRSSKNTRRVLGVNLAFYDTEAETLGTRLATNQELLSERSSLKRYTLAVLRTAWQTLVAGMVPIYLLLAWLLLHLVKRGARTLVERTKAKPDVDVDDIQRIETLTTVGKSALRAVIVVAAALLILDALSVDIGPLIGGAAIFGLAISFGSQSLVKDVVTGFFILLENQYAVGDSVDVNGSIGAVEKITLRRTVLRDLQGRLHNIPNGSITTVINNSQGWARVVIHLGVGYTTDLDALRQLVDATGDAFFEDEEWRPKLSEPPRYIGLTQFGDSALTVRIMFKTHTLENWGAEREFNWRLKQALDAAGIEIPFPQRDVHVRSVVPGAGAPAEGQQAAKANDDATPAAPAARDNES